MAPRKGWTPPVQNPDASVDPYATLGVARNASPDEIRAAWKKAVLKNHPDKVGDDGTAFRRVQSAYESLRVEKAATPLERKQKQRRREYEARRRDVQKWREEERAAAAKEYNERQAAKKEAMEAMREAEEKARKEKQQAERRIMAEGRSNYEARIERERREAYMEKCREYQSNLKAKQAEHKRHQGKSWADKQQERHKERFQARLRRYHQSEWGPSVDDELHEDEFQKWKADQQVQESRPASPKWPSAADILGEETESTGGGLPWEVDDDDSASEASADERDVKRDVRTPPPHPMPPAGPPRAPTTTATRQPFERKVEQESWFPNPWQLNSIQHAVLDRRQAEREAVMRNFAATRIGLGGMFEPTHGSSASVVPPVPFGMFELFSR